VERIVADYGLETIEGYEGFVDEKVVSNVWIQDACGGAIRCPHVGDDVVGTSCGGRSGRLGRCC
jgi:hypothetical protein